ncbi:MAG: hypothetical protein AB1646_06785 [Thermodesulfobacteriota bacterium]
MRIEVDAEVFPEGSFMVAHAKSLDVSSCGATADEAVSALMEAVRLFVSTALDMGTLEKILVESGYVLQGDAWIVTRCGEGRPSGIMLPVPEAMHRPACAEF